MSDEMVDNLREWLTMAEGERDALKAQNAELRVKNAELREALKEAFSALQAMSLFPGATAPEGLAKQIRKALED